MYIPSTQKIFSLREHQRGAHVAQHFAHIENRTDVVNPPGRVHACTSFPRLEAPARAIAAHGVEQHM
ncbi:hypothetical protein Y032_0002g743 [Ancylostoma ceylanicum]|uniref:Uncharacterized protein n=1 Tax=Ancylostoma ceylanicum TaxID=53326 RepID=A0A016W128_9BILA|nr:hypothetical protein Y032_0002g743 [Ancylostoma ceylanicum]